LFKKVEYPKNRLALFYGITTLSLAFSYINPTGWDAFLIALSPKYAFLQKDVQEYASPFFHYLNKLQGINTGYAVLACLFPILLIIRNKKMDLAQAILVAGLFIMAAKSSRFIAFFGPVAVMVTGKETNILLQDLLKNRATKRIQKAGASVFILFLLSITVFFLAYGNFRGINFGVAKNRTVPVQAVDFMERNRLPGNIYNSPAFGGYITWRAYPDRMTFIDTRWINSTVQFEWRWINDALDSIYSEELHEGRQPLWRRLLDHYNINLIMINLMDAYGTAPELLLKLPEDRQWALVYADSICAIFVRNVPAYEHIIEQFEQPKENIYNIIIAESAYKSVYKQNPNYLITLGKTFYAMGRLEDAVTAYRYASKRMPGNLWIKKKVDETEAELKQKNED
ncbi:MAG TPA: tetratricopeptide repeat protein, partial [Nitrospirae bacterium]|nr:tetratricopeptide repeat protein [Nitrospirota bacterium]